MLSHYYSEFSSSLLGTPCGSVSMESTCNAGDVCNVEDLGLIPGSGRFSAKGNGNTLQYSCLGNPMDGGAWRGYNPWDHKSWIRLDLATKPPLHCYIRHNTTGWLHQHVSTGRVKTPLKRKNSSYVSERVLRNVLTTKMPNKILETPLTILFFWAPNSVYSLKRKNFTTSIQRVKWGKTFFIYPS